MAARFEASNRRGDLRHRRAEARFARRILDDRARDAAYHGALTGLPNRDLLIHDRLVQAIRIAWLIGTRKFCAKAPQWT